MFNLVPFKRNKNLALRNFWGDVEGNLIKDFFDGDFLTSYMPAFKVDIVDKGDNYIVKAEIPGFNKDEISVEVIDDKLVISAQSDKSETDEGQNYLRKERYFGKVMRTFVLDNVKSDQIKASYKNGILELYLPKKEKTQAKPCKIDIT